MEHLKILNSKEKKSILKQLESQYQSQLELPYVFLMNTEQKIFLMSQDVAKIKLEDLRVNSLGVYFGKQEKDGIRLSIEGSQLVGPYAKKNILEVQEEAMMQWFKGAELPSFENIPGYVILKHGVDFLGCGKAKDGKILNYVDKGRRILPKSEMH